MSTPFDLTGGTTTTIGTDPYTIVSDLDGVAPFNTIPDGTEIDVTVKRGSEYEVVTGVVGGSGTTLSRVTVHKSSNGNAKVDWGVGTKEVYSTFSAASIAALQDYQDAGDLPAGSDPDGTEKAIVIQTGSARTLTSKQLAGDIADTVMGMTRDHIEMFTRFTGAHPSLVLSAAGAGVVQPIVGEPGWVGVVDNGATTSQITFNTALSPGNAVIKTNSGWSALSAGVQPVAVDTTKDVDVRATVGLNLLPNGTGQNFQFYFGVMQRPQVMLGAVPAFGAFFRATEGSTYWECVVDDNVSAPLVETTTVLVTKQVGFFPNQDVLRVYHNGTDNQTEFYINGALVATITDADRPWPTFDNSTVIYSPTAYIRNVSGTSTKSATLLSFRFDMETALTYGQLM